MNVDEREGGLIISNKPFIENVQSELERILAYWSEKTVDHEHGGFYGALDEYSEVVPNAAKGLVLNARLLWTFSRAYRFDRNPKWITLAERAWQVLEQQFSDQEYGGYYWMLNHLGEPVHTKKQTYGQAFVLYALAEYILATGNQKLLPRLQQIFTFVELSYDPLNNGYYEAFTREWEAEQDLRLGSHDLNEKKSMNTHLHILEAYTNAYRVWKSDILRQRLQNLIVLTAERIVDHDTGHFLLFFDEYWAVKSDKISYGHDIEGSWLLYEAAEVLGDAEVLEKIRPITLAMADAVLAEGIDQDGGLWNEADATGLIDRDKDWWPQAEAAVGFINAWQITGDQKYYAAAEKSWNFIENHMLDREHGEWFWKVSETGIPYPEPKVSEWKCPYHNGRACFELLERMKVEVEHNGSQF
ncbi:AGE family epimerase/isomerase [Saccharibacillus sp. JS10]|uniref:AGE family epimerase/isomerase n=1 Tax=Saccharibacillus sp. JS10 TaxID=2950552 RepID=UPI00210C3269|nr:AGE family epimerase/isomerase [Saccharibacillus sp. JS10]MCQ4086356.1 AGE family epimerase/isomerase [Saccharibacillus sp. JS10]